jgi:hypothetical protein
MISGSWESGCCDDATEPEKSAVRLMPGLIDMRLTSLASMLGDSILVTVVKKCDRYRWEPDRPGRARIQ